MVLDIKEGSFVELVGNITEKRIILEPDGGRSFYYMRVQGREFSVNKEIYKWVSEGEEGTFAFWPRTEKVVHVRK